MTKEISFLHESDRQKCFYLTCYDSAYQK